MKKATVNLSYDAEKLNAVRRYMARKNQALEEELGELRYPLDTVVKAVRAAYRKQGLRPEGYQARLMEQLEKLCPSQPGHAPGPSEAGGPEIQM